MSVEPNPGPAPEYVNPPSEMAAVEADAVRTPEGEQDGTLIDPADGEWTDESSEEVIPE